LGEIRLGLRDLRSISLFENCTGVRVKDCVEGDDKVVFLVGKGFASIAIGKRGSNVEKVRNTINKKVEVIEDSPDLTQFLKNLFYSYRVTKVEIAVKVGGNGDRKKIGNVWVDPRDKGKAIGKSGSNIDLLRKLASRNHEVDTIIVR
jgi:N utilization substance protein A